jgi:hypothetical protein
MEINTFFDHFLLEDLLELQEEKRINTDSVMCTEIDWDSLKEI